MPWGIYAVRYSVLGTGLVLKVRCESQCNVFQPVRCLALCGTGMPGSCVAPSCRNAVNSSAVDAQGRPITLHMFPKDLDCRQQWTLAVQRWGPGGAPWKPSRFSRLCSAHFTEDCMDRTGQAVRVHKGAVPTLFNLRKRLKRRAIQPKPPEGSDHDDDSAYLDDIAPSPPEEMSLDRVQVKEALVKDHNYHCASSSKDLKKALDMFLLTEDKLLNRLRNIKKRESRLTDRVCWLVMQLERKQLSEQPVELNSLCAGTGPEERSDGNDLDSHPQQTSETDACPEQEGTSENHHRLSGENLSPRPDCEESASDHRSTSHGTQTEEGISPSSRFGNSFHEESAPNNKRPYSEAAAAHGEHPYTCLEGRKRFTPPAKLPRKQLRCAGGNLFQCRICGKSYSLLKSLKMHQQKHPITASMKKELALERRAASGNKPDSERRPHQCAECGKRFSSKKYATRHERVHSEAKLHPCSICGKNFRQASYRLQHERGHSKEKAYSCTECGKSFRGTSDLKRHCRTHSGDRPFQCSDCGKSFSLADYLKVHQKIHTGETRCICSECGKCFSRVSYLKTHNRIHTGEKPYTCPECGKSFIDTLRLSRHRLTHKGKKSFTCTECGKSFTTKINVTRHEKKHANAKRSEEKSIDDVINKGEKLFIV